MNRPVLTSRSYQRGYAVVISLAFIMLLLGIILAFFVKTQNHFVVESSSSAGVRSEIFARSALDYTVGLLTNEVTTPDRSTPMEVGDTKLFIPKQRSYMVPEEHVRSNMGLMKQAHMPSLIKMSIPSFDPMSSGVKISAKNKQGSFFDPYRLGDSWFFFAENTQWDSSKAPEWIYFDHDGATKDASPNILGRAAFVIHQTDNLIDFNVGGYPAALSGNIEEVNKLKASYAAADLIRVLWMRGFSHVYSDPTNRFVDTRSRRTTRDGTYVQSVLANNDGFLNSPAGDTQFANRTDLLGFARSNGLSNNPLAYMTPWSRTVEAPSWQPPTLSEANYFAPAILRTTTAQIDDWLTDGSVRPLKLLKNTPVVQRRFPLNRIAWFDSSLPGKDRALRRYFGCRPGINGQWIYEDNTIRTLEELRAAEREPNFFEMLKAAIVSGSLGRSFPVEEMVPADVDATLRDASRDLQIFHIGMNIIDNAREKNLPTVLSFQDLGGMMHLICGIKNLPYLYSVRFRQLTKLTATDDIERVDLYAVPVLVNPHATPLNSETRPPIRLRMIGTVLNAVSQMGGDSSPSEPLQPLADSVGRILPINQDGFHLPAPPQKGWFSTNDPDEVYARMPDDFTGTIQAIRVASGTVSGTGVSRTLAFGKATLQKVDFVLEYLNENSIWIPYDSLTGNEYDKGLGDEVQVEFSGASGFSATLGDAHFTGANTPYYLKPDPRTARWGVVRGRTPAPIIHTQAAQTIPSQGVEAYAVPGIVPNNVFPTVTDRDGTVRLNDLAIGSQNSPAAPKTMALVLTDSSGGRGATSRSEERQLILHRLYYTVGELGGVFRGEPWKTINFATRNSGDAALLDYFTINETGPSGLVAGRVNPNPVSPPDMLVPQLMDTGYLINRSAEYVTGGRAYRNESESTDADYAALYINNLIRTATPFLSPADLVGCVSFSQLPIEMKQSKQRQETYVRAVGTAIQTRTWNFFIDLIAQSGKMTPLNATSLEKDFIPRAETRFWMHVAIDRFTGKVIASHVEQYQE